ncbi:MAG: hypothetical protein AB2L07_18650 [Thermoanaerobaculaceae bacterium]
MVLTTDLQRADERPYFLWDEELTVRELREALHGQDESERVRLLAKLLREARDDEVWQLITPVGGRGGVTPDRAPARPAARLLGVPHRGMACRWSARIASPRSRDRSWASSSRASGASS